MRRPPGLVWGIGCVAILCALRADHCHAEPLTGPHLLLWLDAQEMDGRAAKPADGAAVIRWADKGPHGNHALQPSPDRRPTYVAKGISRNAHAVRFDASGQQYLIVHQRASLNLSQLTAFVVARAGNSPSNMWLFGKNDWGPPWTGYGIAVSRDGSHPWPHCGLARPGASGAVAQGLSIQFGGDIGRQAAIVEICCDGKRLEMLLNGRIDKVQRAAGRILPNDRDLLIGAGPQSSPACEYLQGEVAEILLYDQALDAAQRSQTRRYLAEKYGLSLAGDSQASAVDECRPNQVIDNGYLPVSVENPSTPETKALSPAAAAAALERDWLMQSMGEPLAQRAVKEIRWGRELAARLSGNAPTPQQRDALAELAELEHRLQSATPPANVAKEHPPISPRPLAGEGQEMRADGGTGATGGLSASVEKTRADKLPVPPPNSAYNAGIHQQLYFDVRKAKRRIALSNPVLDFTKLLLIDQPYPQGPEWPHQAVHRLGHRAVSGGRLLVLDGLHPGTGVRLLAPARKPGSFWRPDLSFDARRVLFCYKAHDEKSFHLYEIGMDGSGLKQLTSGDYDDLDPIYTSDGHILFTTTRGNTYVRCGPYIYSTLLARCDADGRSVYLLSQNSEPDFVPALLNDGRVVYSRWEYTDKSVFRVQSLWTTNPDGTNTMALWGNQSVWPDHLAEPRPIPGSDRVMFSGVGHHDWFTGSIGIIDPARGFNYPQGIMRVTWDLPWTEVGSPSADRPEAADYHASGRFTSYKTPYPLSESDFLVSARAADDKFRLYLMDVHGNRELLYEGQHHVWHAVPLRPRVVPPRIPDRVAWPGTEANRRTPAMGRFYNADVYQGAPDLPRGTVKYLRVVQSDPKTYSTWFKTFRLSGPPISAVYEESVKRILSEVPVEPDGSVYFEAPPGRALHFQLLDEHYRCLQTMRSFAGLMPGEQRGCVGCHESHGTAPPARPGRALRRAPSAMAPPWGDESVGYERFAQPALDRYCVECHRGKAKGSAEPDLALRPAVSVFKEPYLTLVGPAGWGNPLGGRRPGAGIAGAIAVETMDETKLDPRALATLRPMTTLSSRSRLVELASRGDHYGVKVDPPHLRRLMAWVDANCPFVGDEELRQMADPDFPGIEELPIRPRVKTAPVIARP
jgi:hypothetical protein